MRISGYVTVILPVRNGALTIRRCLEAIAAQTYRPLEIVVVDDGSTDSTPGWVRSFRQSHPELNVHVVTQKATGLGAALAEGLARARGEFLAFADQADEWDPRKLDRQVRQLQENPRLGISAAEVTLQVGETATSLAAPKHLLYELVPASSLVMRREAVESAGGFETATLSAPYHAMCFRLSQGGGMARLKEPVATCHRAERPTLPTAQLAATLEQLTAEGRFSAKELRLGLSRLYALQGWQALFADEPERARMAFQSAMDANPWLPETWFGMACARVDHWLFATGLLKPDGEHRRLVHAKR